MKVATGSERALRSFTSNIGAVTHVLDLNHEFHTEKNQLIFLDSMMILIGHDLRRIRV